MTDNSNRKLAAIMFADIVSLAQKRLDDLQRYMDNIMKEKDSKEYKEFYKRIDIVKNQNMFEIYSTIHEYEELLNKTHIFNTAT